MESGIVEECGEASQPWNGTRRVCLQAQGQIPGIPDGNVELPRQSSGCRGLTTGVVILTDCAESQRGNTGKPMKNVSREHL